MAHEKHNKMGLNSVAMIMAPNLFLCTNKAQPTLQEIKQAQGTVNIVRMLIKYQAILWTVSGVVFSLLNRNFGFVKCNWL